MIKQWTIHEVGLPVDCFQAELNWLSIFVQFFIGQQPQLINTCTCLFLFMYVLDICDSSSFEKAKFYVTEVRQNNEVCK